jgi:hypothetical protein
MKDQLTKASPSLQKAISHQLELMLANPIFNATPKRVAILKYVSVPGQVIVAHDMKTNYPIREVGSV